MRQSCFPYLAREKADDAQVVVTNHAMLGVAATGLAVLPAADAYIVDEAHDLADRVTSQLTRKLSKYEISGVARLLRRSGLDDAGLDECSDELNELLSELPEGRLTELAQDFLDVIARILGRLQVASEDISGLSNLDEEQATTKYILRSRVQELQELCSDVLSDAVGDDRLVVWKAEFGEANPAMYIAPLDVAHSLADNLFEDQPTILTSATLKIGDSFEAMASRAGLTFPSQGPWEGVDVGSPFVPEKQGVLYVAGHLPVPGKEGYGEEQLQEITELIQASDGGALALFTSRAGALRAAEYVRQRSDLPVFVQGEDQLSTLVANFTRDEQACLFGTLSLWQGVDVPGRTCRLVIIDRIPFPRPNDPLTQARTDAVVRAGGNGFMSIAATQAALLLAQGAGRLLRRSSDRGVVAVLDPRLMTARYAGFLLASMPRMWRTADPKMVREILERLANES